MSYKINKDITYKKGKDGIVIYIQGGIFLLNSTASLIFSEILKNREKKDIVKKITSMYNITQKKAEEDFDKFIKELKKKKIIVEE
jgi:hypothetical protein